MRYQERNSIINILDLFAGIIGLLTLISLIIIVGFYLEESILQSFYLVNNILIGSFILQEIIRWFFQQNVKKHLKSRLLENIFSLLMIATFVFPDEILLFTSKIFPEFSIKQLTLIYLALIEGSLMFVLLIEGLRYSRRISRIDLNPGSLFAISFLIIIAFGTLFLMLPRMTVGDNLSFTDALFTSTSAVCVTGLIVVDTAEKFTNLGKVFILFLIQIGGLGVMTLTTFLAYLFAGGISLKFRVMMKDMLSEESLGQVRSILFKIALLTFIFEMIGVVFLYLTMGGSFIQINREYLYSSIFHSVSAFCNAGFSIYSSGLAEPHLSTNVPYLIVIMLLIVIGGLGFPIFSNFMTLFNEQKRNFRFRYRIKLATKIVLVTTALLLAFGAFAAFFANDWSGYNMNDRILHSIFLSVTSRTAGFNTIPIDDLAAPILLIMLFLMWIGASPGSTGGGIKTTTFAINVLALYNMIIGKDKVELFNRELSQANIRRSSLVIIASLIALSVGSIILVWIEPNLDPLDLIFEVTSAIGTVGLSRGVTSELGTGAKLVITVLMFIGRIGVLTFFLSFYSPKYLPNYKLPEETVMTG